MPNSITQIHYSEWIKLRNLFKINWPENIASYLTIDNFIRWYKQHPNINYISFYSLNDDWSDGTFLIVVSFSLKNLLS